MLYEFSFNYRSNPIVQQQECTFKMPPTPDAGANSTMQQQATITHRSSYDPNSTTDQITTTDFSSPLTTEEQMQNDAFDDIFNGLGGDYLGFLKGIVAQQLGHLAQIQNLKASFFIPLFQNVSLLYSIP